MTLAFVPRGTGVAELAQRDLSPGLMSAGLGSVPAQQTYLDISQGNRVFDSLYDWGLPAEVGGGICGPPYRRSVVERADSAPADIVPGLLASTLAAAREGCRVRSSTLAGLSRLVRGLRGDDLLIAIERPPPPSNEALAIGIAGRGFDGDLTSDSTRMDGYVLSTDVAPTILGRLGVAVPQAMTGRAIRSEGAVDPAAVVSLGDRMSLISERRGPVIGLALLAWVLLLGLAAIAGRGGSVVRTAVRIAGLSIVYLPLTLLAGAALEASQGVEQALALAGAPLLALITLSVLPGFKALFVASAFTVLAYGIDVVAGSPLTSLSLLGPNPGLGVRFYGIGNELEALLAVLVVAGTGAGLSGFAPRLSPQGSATVFLLTGLVFAFAFAAGRFGADVGAAIVLPLGAAVAAATLVPARRTALAVVAIPLAALALLALADLASGANAHLTRSVLDAGGLDEVAQVAQRRLQLSAHSFTRPIVFVFLPLIGAATVAAFLGRHRIAVWLRRSAAMRAGLIGAVAAVLIGALVNDSGALLIEIGAAYLLVFTGFAWAEAAERG